MLMKQYSIFFFIAILDTCFQEYDMCGYEL